MDKRQQAAAVQVEVPTSPAITHLLLADGGFEAGGILTFKHGTAEETRLVSYSQFSDSSYLTLDLLLVTPVFEPVWLSRETATLSDMEFKVVSKSGLSLMKQLAGRAQDKADLEKLNETNETPS